MKDQLPDWLVKGLVRTVDPKTGQVWWVKEKKV